MQRKAPTIADVAATAGVSVPTVSRVLTGRVPVSVKRRDLVMRAIDELGFRPNAAARALANGRPSMIAVLAANTSRFGYAMTLEGVEEAARARGYMTMITVIEATDAAGAKAAIDVVLGQPVAGVIVISFDEFGEAALRALPKSMATAAAGNAVPSKSPVPQVQIAEKRAAAEAVKYLLGLGHQTVHHVALPSGNLKGGRTAGWMAALRGAGVATPQHLVASWDAMSGYELGCALARDPDVTAVFCGNDEIAIGVMRAMAEAGKDVPDAVSVVGFDDQPIAQMWMPSLTTVRQDFVELGRRTVALLQSRISNEAAPSNSLPAQFIVRASTGPPPVRLRRQR